MQLIRFFGFNLLGHLLPMLVAVASVPVMARFGGVDRLGALGVVLALVGYFGFLDFGLSRVVTRRVAYAQEHGLLADELGELRSFFLWWALPSMLLIALCLLVARHVFDAYFPPGFLGDELRRGWAWIAWSIPIALATNWLRGALEGMQRFARVNLLRTLFGTWNYAVPAVVVLYVPTLDAMIVAIVAGRLLALFAHLWTCFKVDPRIVVGPAPRRPGSVGHFFREGGWITVSNLISPLMIYADRFVLAALLPAKAVAWYVTSQEMMQRTLIVPAALSGVVFPKIAGTSGGQSADESVALYRRSVRFTAGLMLPVCSLAAAVAYDGMCWWLGRDFALSSYRVVQIAALGVFFNAIAYMPFAWLQAVGRSRVSGRIHLVEMPIYATALYYCVWHWGILGAAWVWTARVSVDCILLLFIAVRYCAGRAIVIALTGGALIAIAAAVSGPQWTAQWRIAACVAVLTVACAGAWFGLLDRAERNRVWEWRNAL